MKNLPFLLVLAIALLLCINSQAQFIKAISIRTGLASTFPDITELQDGRPVNDGTYIRNMLYPELQAELFPRNHFSLLTNIAYISKGFNRYSPGSGGLIPTSGGIVAENVDYLTFIAAPKISKQLDGITFYAFSGPYIGFRTAYDAYYVQGLYFMPGDLMEVQVLKPRTFGGTIGGGFEFKGKSKTFYYSLQAQYMQDFTRAVDFRYSMTTSYGRKYDYLFKARFQTVLLSFGIHYNFRKKEK